MRNIVISLILLALLGCTDYEQKYHETAALNDRYLLENEELRAKIKEVRGDIGRIEAKRISNNKLSKQCIALSKGGVWAALTGGEKVGIFLMLAWSIGAWVWILYVSRNREWVKDKTGGRLNVLLVSGLLLLLFGCADWESKYYKEEHRRENLSSLQTHLKSELNNVESKLSYEYSLLNSSEEALKKAQSRAGEKGYVFLQENRLSTIVICVCLFVWGCFLFFARNIIYQLFKNNCSP
jgi:hypothetical protein